MEEDRGGISVPSESNHLEFYLFCGILLTLGMVFVMAFPDKSGIPAKDALASTSQISQHTSR